MILNRRDHERTEDYVHEDRTYDLPEQRVSRSVPEAYPHYFNTEEI